MINSIKKSDEKFFVQKFMFSIFEKNGILHIFRTQNGGYSTHNLIRRIEYKTGFKVKNDHLKLYKPCDDDRENDYLEIWTK